MDRIAILRGGFDVSPTSQATDLGFQFRRIWCFANSQPKLSLFASGHSTGTVSLAAIIEGTELSWPFPPP